jgi:hypothetical protein
LFFFRRVVQDRERIHFREQTPTVPEEETAGAATASAMPVTG